MYTGEKFVYSGAVCYFVAVDTYLLMVNKYLPT